MQREKDESVRESWKRESLGPWADHGHQEQVVGATARQPCVTKRPAFWASFDLPCLEHVPPSQMDFDESSVKVATQEFVAVVLAGFGKE